MGSNLNRRIAVFQVTQQPIKTKKFFSGEGTLETETEAEFIIKEEIRRIAIERKTCMPVYYTLEISKGKGERVSYKYQVFIDNNVVID